MKRPAKEIINQRITSLTEYCDLLTREIDKLQEKVNSKQKARSQTSKEVELLTDELEKLK